MIVGYARTSTIEQEAGFEAQLKQLKAAGCEKVFSEQVSAVAATREQFEAALDFVREGDSFIVTKLDRLARSVPHLCEIGARLEAKGVALKVLDQAIDTSTPTGQADVQPAWRHCSVREGVDPRADAGRHCQG